MSKRQEVIELLRGLADGSIKPSKPHWGLCIHINKILGEGWYAHPLHWEIVIIMRNWPKADGNDLYPVPHPDYLNRGQAFNETKNMWDRRTQYTHNRIELALYTADKLEDRTE